MCVAECCVAVTHPPTAPTRRLAEKIRAARVNKERAVQLQEKQQMATMQAQYDAAFNTYLEANEAAAAAREAEFQTRRKEQGVHGRKMLEEQIDERKVRVGYFMPSSPHLPAFLNCSCHLHTCSTGEPVDHGSK